MHLNILKKWRCNIKRQIQFLCTPPLERQTVQTCQPEISLTAGIPSFASKTVTVSKALFPRDNMCVFSLDFEALEEAVRVFRLVRLLTDDGPKPPGVVYHWAEPVVCTGEDVYQITRRKTPQCLCSARGCSDVCEQQQNFIYQLYHLLKEHLSSVCEIWNRYMEEAINKDFISLTRCTQTYSVASFYGAPRHNFASIRGSQSHLACRDTCGKNQRHLNGEVQ